MITVLADDNNQRGDIFTRLMADVFASLGYDQLRFNVHQTGREVDIIGTHCTEHRMLTAECKAQADPIGGSDLNKFYGVLDAERRKNQLATEGYFVSTSGFKESAIQQEKDLGNRFSLLGPDKVIFQLIRGHIIVDQTSAASQASKWLGAASLAKVAGFELLAHDSGWHWLIKFAEPGAAVSSFSVVHADGHVLERPRSRQIVESLNYLTQLEYVGPDVQEPNEAADEARARYIEYLINEYGYITLEGLPADQEVGYRSLRLESIFVPLSLEKAISDVMDQDASEDSDKEKELADPEVDDLPTVRSEAARHRVSKEPAGKVLANNNRLAILGAPGAGKSTLLKRLAVAYAVPGRRAESSDQLPERDWFPIVIRCRHLGNDVRQPLLKAIQSLAERAEMPELSKAFQECVTRELREGHVLLLIDGLDEIASPAERSAFVTQLRTFLGTYPSASLVVTSREVGFRTVAGAVASLCTTYRVTELSNKDVTTITLAWHREVVGPSARVREDAAELARSILRTDRVRRLAVNPLLLTTLLLVRRWLGELPRKRSVLYAKAIEVLLMTWNVEGHQPLDPDEALPQLAFAAFRMMQRNVQSVSIKVLTDYFTEARRQMPELLGYSRLSVSEFVSRVEERSSLLSLSGHIIEDGQLRAIYEFKHLTFQEYLAALAATQGYYPNRKDGEQLADVLDPYLTRASWREVLPLAGVLGGRSSGVLIERIIEKIGSKRDFYDTKGRRPSGKASSRSDSRRDSLVALLARCLADEVPLGPDTLEKAIEFILTQATTPPYHEILSGRYGSELYRIARIGYEGFDNFVFPYGSAVAAAVLAENSIEDNAIELGQQVFSRLNSADAMDKAEGCLIAMRACFDYTRSSSAKAGPATPLTSTFVRIRTELCKILQDETDPRVLLAGHWALCWLAEIRKPTITQTTKLLPSLWNLWQSSQHEPLQRQCAWAIWKLPLLERGQVSLEYGNASKSFLRREFTTDKWLSSDRHRAALVIAYYLQVPWTDEELIEMAQSSDPHLLSRPYDQWWKHYLKSFGARGLAAIQTVQETQKRQVAR